MGISLVAVRIIIDHISAEGDVGGDVERKISVNNNLVGRMCKHGCSLRNTRQYPKLETEDTNF